VLEVGFGVFFWANVLLVSGFLVYLPRSKHLHIVTAFFNAALRKLRPRGELPAMDLESEDVARFGVKTIEDLNWKDLLDGFTCTECGRCQEACPAWATGKPLNPKTMIMGIREMAVEAEHGVPLVPWITGRARRVGIRGRPTTPVRPMARAPAHAGAPHLRGRPAQPVVALARPAWRSPSSTRPSRTTRCGTASPAARASRHARCSSSTSTRSSACGATWSSRRAASRPS
jgi:ferredoxin